MIDENTDPAMTPKPSGGPGYGPAPEHEPGHEDDSVRDVLTRLYDSGRDYAEAEIDRQKARAAIMGLAVRDAAILGMVAAFLILAALMALLIGLIIALAPALTPIGATGAVVSGAILLAVILLLLGRARIRSMKKAIRA